MKRFTYLAVATGILLLITTACGKSSDDTKLMMTDTFQTAVEASGSQPAIHTLEDRLQTESEAVISTKAAGDETGNSVEAAETAGNYEGAASEAASQEKEPAAKGNEPEKANSTGVIAKSNNVVTGEDNGKVMSELDKELDALFSSINRLEDVDRAVLDGEVDVK